MINSDLPTEASRDERVDRIVAGGPRGAFALAGIAACVIALWLAFYLFVFLPRGALQ